MLSLAEACMISTLLQGTLYGLSMSMSAVTIWILVRNRQRRCHLNRTMLAATCALIILSTTEYALNILRLVQGLIRIGPHLTDGIEQYFTDVSKTSFIIKGVLYNCQTLILDGVVIYRAYVVWQRWYIIIVPVLGWLGLAVGSVGSSVALAHATTNAENLFATTAGQWLIAIYSITLGTNLAATGLLAFRIWTVDKRTEKLLSSNRCSNLRTMLHVIVESGAIYSATILVALATFAVGSRGVYVLLDMLSPIIGIVFNMIIVRVGFATESPLSDLERSMTHAPSAFQFAERSESRPSNTFRPRHDNGIDVKSVTIELTRAETEADTTSSMACRGVKSVLRDS